jgi:hypothetical protein
MPAGDSDALYQDFGIERQSLRTAGIGCVLQETSMQGLLFLSDLQR